MPRFSAVPFAFLLLNLPAQVTQAQSATGAQPAPQTAAVAASEEEQAFWKKAGIDSGNPVHYLDQNKQPISFAQARQLIAGGHVFSVDLQDEQTLILMKGLRSKIAIKLQNGDAFPEFTLPGLNLPAGTGKQISKQNLLGRTTLINFYFAECGPCIREAARLSSFARQHKELNLLAITFDSPPEVRQFIQQQQFVWPVAAGAKDLIKQVGVPAYPAFVLLAADGKVLATDFPPRLEWELSELEAWVSKNGQLAR